MTEMIPIHDAEDDAWNAGPSKTLRTELRKKANLIVHLVLIKCPIRQSNPLRNHADHIRGNGGDNTWVIPWPVATCSHEKRAQTPSPKLGKLLLLCMGGAFIHSHIVTNSLGKMLL